MANSCREGTGSSETYTCFEEAAAALLDFKPRFSKTPIQIQMENTGKGNTLTDFFHMELLFLSTKLVLIRWTKNTHLNSLQKLYPDSKAVQWPPSWLPNPPVPNDKLTRGRTKKKQTGALSSSYRHMNCHSCASHVPTVEMRKREEKDPLIDISNLRKPCLRYSPTHNQCVRSVITMCV